MTLYRRRELGSEVVEALQALPVVVVSGLRKAGKTTLLQNEPALAGKRFATLDEMGTLECARRDAHGSSRATNRSGSSNFVLPRSITESPRAGRSV